MYSGQTPLGQLELRGVFFRKYIVHVYIVLNTVSVVSTLKCVLIIGADVLVSKCLDCCVSLYSVVCSVVG